MSADILYSLIGVQKEVDKTEIVRRFEEAGIKSADAERAFKLMLWYGVIGVLTVAGNERYIYDYNYSMKRLEAEVRSYGEKARFVANDAIHVGLAH